MIALSRRRVLLGLSALGSATALAGCKIVPMATSTDGRAAGTFDAHAYAAELWTGKGRSYLIESARPLPEVLAAIARNLDDAGKEYGFRPAAEGAAWTFVVSGEGVIVSKNTQSRAGTLIVRIGETDQSAEVTIQIGPVVRGNAVRDALPFVSFKDFTNQLEYADAGKALTALAMESVTLGVASIDAGKLVAFVGAFSLKAADEKLLITPISLDTGPTP